MGLAYYMPLIIGMGALVALWLGYVWLVAASDRQAIEAYRAETERKARLAAGGSDPHKGADTP